MIRTAFLFLVGVMVFATHGACAATPEDISPLWSGATDGDLAGSWLTFLFRGESAHGTNVDMLSSLAQAVREGLSIYGLSMLTIAGFLLAWQVVSMIAETAQTGVVMGSRTNQLWAPMRFLIGITLLIPLGSGLSVGQNIIVRIATSGSGLASEAWREVIEIVGDKFMAPLAPMPSNIERVVATSFEIELCRSLYHQVFSAFRIDPIVALSGDMPDFVKLPPQRLTEETWRTTNAFFADAALCGEYRFNTPHVSTPPTSSQEDQASGMLAEASRLLAQRLILQNRVLAEKVSSAFLSTEAQTSVPADVQNSLAGAVKEQTRLVDAKLQQISGGIKKDTVTSRAQARGWISAGSFPFDMARTQIILGEASVAVLPKVKAPLFGHDALSYDGWMKVGADRTAMHGASLAQFASYATVFDRMSESMKKARAWLYERQMGDPQFVLPDQQDVRDVLNPYADSEVALSAFTRLMTSGAAAYGVFARAPQSQVGAYGYNAADSVLPDRAYLVQPLQTLAETGRRFMAYGGWLMGVLSPALAQPTTIGMALCLGVIALLFWGAGAGLLFVVPFIPFYRFLIAVLSWGLSVMMAVVSLPVVALGHLYPAGDGLVGPLARRAYWLWLGIFIRPSLILFAFVAGLIFFLLGVGFINLLFFEWMVSVAVPQSEVLWLFRSAMALLYALSVFVVANVSFRGLATFPSTVMAWIDARSFMPESGIVNGPRSGNNAAGFAASGHTDGIAVASMASGGAASSTRQASHSATKGGKGPTPPSRQAQAAHFPYAPEEKASERAEAKAEASAYAKAETSHGGKSETAVYAGSSAGSESAKALSLSHHTMSPESHDSGKGHERLGHPKAYRKNELDTVVGEQKGPTPSPAGPQSAEQTTAPLDDDKNPFKSGPVGEGS